MTTTKQPQVQSVDIQLRPTPFDLLTAVKPEKALLSSWCSFQFVELYPVDRRLFHFGGESLLIAMHLLNSVPVLLVQPITKVPACKMNTQLKDPWSPTTQDFSLLISELPVAPQFLHCVCCLATIEHKSFLDFEVHYTDVQLKDFLSVKLVMCIEEPTWCCCHSEVQCQVLFPFQVYTSLSIVKNGNCVLEYWVVLSVTGVKLFCDALGAAHHLLYISNNCNQTIAIHISIRWCGSLFYFFPP